MKYIKQDERGFTSFDDYFEYIEAIKGQLDERLYAFAADSSRYDLTSKGSLHDAWVQSLQVEVCHGEGATLSNPSNITLTLLGPFHDRVHTLKYFDVKWSSVNLQLCGNQRQRDLLYHEMRLQDGLLQHEFAFDGDRTLEIHCAHIEHEERIF